MSSAEAVATSAGGRVAVVGRPFMHPAVDLMLIGGGLSLIATVVVALTPEARGLANTELVAYAFLLSNSAHFASSTVRLYTKPGAFTAMPFLTMGLPLVTLAALAACVALPASFGLHLQSLYLTWSPYHYAAQAYGLAIVYAYRGGVQLGTSDKRLLWWSAMLPFFHAFLTGDQSGLGWITGGALLPHGRAALAIMGTAKAMLLVLSFGAPLLLLARSWRTSRGPLPLICPLLLVANAAWWLVLTPLDAFFWATIFHGIQYLAIVLVFHVREQAALPGNVRSPLAHAVRFYGLSLALGYGLFHLLPLAFVAAGAGMVESLFLVATAVNVHHFVVDAFIWRFKPGGANRRVVEAAAPQAVPA